ncbi:hypothetical protein GOP47_0000785 [Adiantum capillus-veneris]|uniref:Uncharacterized protein n=1 Tax=Adiantum capillus-veneris TaxID=13818 RepID=A0A9D4VDM7_ADICA|nr:hypothetical protein GOP47_0000785 [Adiantum capillus-veneris]
MAKREYSNGLQHLKFMQRAKQREEVAKKAEEDATVADEGHWVVPAIARAAGKRCTVILEGDPKPGALLGRMSFQNCNTSIDKLLEEAEAVHKRRFSAAKEKAEAAHSASIDSSRSESVKGEDGSAIAAEEETTVQFKKPKVGAINNLSAGGGARGWQNQNRSDNKAWQGWRSQGDYRMLRPPPKG